MENLKKTMEKIEENNGKIEENNGKIEEARNVKKSKKQFCTLEILPRTRFHFYTRWHQLF